MGQYYFPLLVILLLLAIFTKNDFVFTVIYLFAGVFALGTWWSSTALKGLIVQRNFVDRAFPGEDVKVVIQVENTSWLPILWLKVVESLPVELVGNQLFRRVITIGPKQTVELEYSLFPNKRGVFKVGPTIVSSGDILGISQEMREGEANYLIVYPRVLGLTKLALPSRSPMGTMRSRQPILQDPTRIIGKRRYVVGDSLRSVDWKSTAVTGNLQVKVYEPSMDLDTAVFLNFSRSDYHYRRRIEATELAVVVGASILNWLTSKKQNISLFPNAVDPFSENHLAKNIPSRKGQSHLMRILELLARIEIGDELKFNAFLQRHIVRLPWGTTIVVVSGKADIDIFNTLYQARKSGLTVVLILCGSVAELQDIKTRALFYGIHFYHIVRESDLSVWQQ